MVKITSSGWRPNKKGVAAVTEKLVELKEGEKGSMVIFFGLDNGLFYEADEDGERSLPGKGNTISLGRLRWRAGNRPRC